jgi:NAD-dependent SIR2 family protein deacetylase
MLLASASYTRIAQWFSEADGLIVAAGAGMGVDSGLPDFRGSEGFWRAYPALGRARLHFEEIANPAAFARDPALAWGFYGHRLALYRRTVPHRGFALLQEIAARLSGGGFVFTSNVDGQFQKAGFADARIMEVHGSIHHLQCQRGCRGEVWSAEGFAPQVDEEHCRLLGEPPPCPHCGGGARPNILMFGDEDWIAQRTEAQQVALVAWLERVRRPLVIEIGAGENVPTVRRFAESSGRRLLRINPQAEPALPAGAVHLRCGAREGILAVHAAVVGGR